MRRRAGMTSNSRGSASSFWTRCLSPSAPSASDRTCTPPSDEAPGVLSSAGFPSAFIAEPRKTASWSSRSCTVAVVRGAGKEEHSIGLETDRLKAARRFPNGGSSWAIGPQAGEASIHVSARDDSIPSPCCRSPRGRVRCSPAPPRPAPPPSACCAWPMPCPRRKSPRRRCSSWMCRATKCWASWRQPNLLLEPEVPGFCFCRRPAPGPMGGRSAGGWLGVDRGLRLAGVYHMAYDDRGRAVQADFLSGR